MMMVDKNDNYSDEKSPEWLLKAQSNNNLLFD